MGNQLTQTNQISEFQDERLRHFESQTEFVEDCEDKCFGSIRVHRRTNISSTNESQAGPSNLIMEKQTFNDQKEAFASLYSESKTRLQMKHPNLLAFLGFEFVNSSDLCSTSMKSRHFFEYESYDLSSEILRRIESQVNIFYILNTIIMATILLILI